MSAIQAVESRQLYVLTISDGSPSLKFAVETVANLIGLARFGCLERVATLLPDVSAPSPCDADYKTKRTGSPRQSGDPPQGFVVVTSPGKTEGRWKANQEVRT